MPLKRFRGVHYRQLLQRLPRNLLVFDGHCLLCQARVRYVVERNFSFFSFLNYASSTVETEMAEGLDRHRIHFASLDSQEGTDVRRSFFQRRASASTSAPGTAVTVVPVPEDLVLIFVEKVPSKSASFLTRMRPGGVATDDRALFHSSTGSSSSSSGGGGAASSHASSARHVGGAGGPASVRLVQPEETDLLVSTNYAAMCRVGMHLDRFLTRSAFRVLYSVVPGAVGDWWFDRYVSRRRKTIWGTTEQDAVQENTIIEGMRERRWTWRSGSGASRR